MKYNLMRDNEFSLLYDLRQGTDRSDGYLNSLVITSVKKIEFSLTTNKTAVKVRL